MEISVSADISVSASKKAYRSISTKNCKQTTKQTVRISLLSHDGPIPGLVMQQLCLANNSGLMQDCQFGMFEIRFESLAFFNHLAFQNLAFSLFFFQLERFGFGKTLSELDLNYKPLLMRVYGHAGCKEYCKISLLT